MAQQTIPLSLYLVFDHKEEKDEENMNFLCEIIEFANNSKLPCHILGQVVVFQNDSTKKACIHKEFKRTMIEKLNHEGFLSEGKDKNNEDMDLISNFKKTAKGEFLPIIISFEHGTTTSDVKKNLAGSTSYQIPDICVMINDVAVSWSIEKNDELSTKEYKTDIKTLNKKSSSEVGPMLRFNHSANKFFCDYDPLIMIICNRMIRVCLEEVSSTKEQYVAYYNALSQYLIDNGIWTIYKHFMKKFFKERYLEYTHEEAMSSKKKISKEGDNHSENGGRSKELLNLQRNGLLFFALLVNNRSDEALDLLEKGHIGIHHILIGCDLLDDEINSWKTPIVMKERLQRYKSAFTERAIAITSSIYRKYKQNKEDASKNGGDKQLINHAERLLLNHGYLRDAISTENNVFLKNETVKTILNEKWYGTENIDLLTMFIFGVLAVIHPLVLPFLMINLERGPLKRLYQLYQLPFLKVVIQMLGFLVVIVAYAYMLLFDYSDDWITYTDCFIIVWMVSFLVDEIKQVVVALIRKQMKKYLRDWWNILDWLFIVGYTSGMVLRFGEGSVFKNTSKCLLVATFMLLCIRVLNLCCMTEFLGPKLVIIRKMIKQTVSFMTILTVIMVWYSVSLYALLYPNSEISWTEIEHIMSNGYWVLFGELNLDAETLTEPDCTFNRTIYGKGVLQRCPTTLGLHLAPYLKAFYGLITVILLMNLLIALYSDAFNVVQQESEAYWRKIQLNFLEEYCIKTAFPIHLQILALPGTILSFLFIQKFGPCGRKRAASYEIKSLENQSKVVTGFLYDATYDIRLKETCAAEQTGAQLSKGTIDLSAVDAITTKIQLEKIEGITVTTKEQTETIEDGIKKTTQDQKNMIEDLKKTTQEQTDKIEDLNKTLTLIKKTIDKMSDIGLRDRWK